MNNIEATLNQYQLLRTIGYGATCKTKLAIDTKSGKKVAIKILKNDLSEAAVTLLFNEVGSMQKLKHENVVKFLEFGHGA